MNLGHLLVAWLLAASTPEALSLFDASRQRSVPVVVYSDTAQRKGRQTLALISHGYGATSTSYSFIANHLAAQGYVVASVQHEIPGDPPLPTTGSVYEARKPSWQRGVENLLFVIGALGKSRPGLDTSQVLLIGHSHGGDTSMLFAQEHPERVRAVITLDNRRMPFPRTSRPRLFSIRSSDLPADPGVLPTLAEQAQFGIRIVTLPATVHNDMWDGGTADQKAEILRILDGFLREQP